MSNRRVIIAGGGTGGHIFPAIAIANALKELDPQAAILFVGAKGKMEMEKVPQAGYDIEGLDIAGFNRSSLLKNIGLPFKLIRSFFQVRRIFRAFKPTAVVGVGGYSSFPVLWLAQQKGIPSFLHESNSFAGRANQMLGKKATRIFVATDGMEKFFPPEKILVTGNPVRKSIVAAQTGRDEAIRQFGLQPGKTTILSTGGSLGARSINQAVEAGLERLHEEGLQLIWQAGKNNLDAAKKTAFEAKGDVWVNEFIAGMETAFAAADIVISRAGAMSIAEICVAKKPAVLVPYPYAAEDHQTVNAQNLVKKEAAILVPDAEVKQRLIDTVIALAKDPLLQKQLKNNIAPLAIGNADKVIAAEIIKLTQ